MKTADTWVVADLKGLAKLVAGRSKAFLVYELVSNALDEATTCVDVTLEKVAGRALARLIVEDDNPNGFADLRHAYSLFAESGKKDNPEQRGRFNLGEKLVLALCRDARIRTTTGSVTFGEDGRRHESARLRTARGSVFEATVHMTQAEFDQCLAETRWLLVPGGVEVRLNGERLPSRTPIRTAEAVLPTVIADGEGVLRPSRRKTTIEIYEPPQGLRGRIYELGIPVVESADRYDANVLQKVPLNMDRDNVTPAFLQALRTAVANATADLLTTDEVTASWVDQALRDPRVEAGTVRRVLAARFGERVVSADPSDPEAVNRAVAAGYTVVTGGMFDRAQWQNVKRADALRPAGHVFPTPRPYSTDPNAPPVDVVSEADWTPGMHAMARRTRRIACALLGRDIGVRIVRTTNAFVACCGTGEIHFNVQRLGHRFFDDYPANRARVLDLLIHELAHEIEGNHLSARYHETLTRFGGALVDLALTEPEVFA